MGKTVRFFKSKNAGQFKDQLDKKDDQDYLNLRGVDSVIRCAWGEEITLKALMENFSIPWYSFQYGFGDAKTGYTQCLKRESKRASRREAKQEIREALREAA